MRRLFFLFATLSLVCAFKNVASATDPPRRVVVIVMENKEYSSIIDNPDAPYINGLADQYALATSYYANHHPSLPNYLDIVAGSNMGIKDDGESYVLSGNFLGRQLYSAGFVERVHAESMPSSETYDRPCKFPTSGSYKKRHNPYSYWDWIQGVNGFGAHCYMVLPYSKFYPDNLKAFTLIVPNICHDMHDCSIATGDAWLKTNVPPILSNMSGGDILILTFDEGSTTQYGGGHVVTIVAGPGARTHFTDSTFYTHYSLLRTIEDIFSLPCLRNACSANSMSNMLQ